MFAVFHVTTPKKMRLTILIEIYPLFFSLTQDKHQDTGHDYNHFKHIKSFCLSPQQIQSSAVGTAESHAHLQRLTPSALS
jgi:hypothetical protein